MRNIFLLERFRDLQYTVNVIDYPYSNASQKGKALHEYFN